MSLITFIIGLVLGWFITNLVTVHQIAEMSPRQVKKLKREVDYLVEKEDDNNNIIDTKETQE